MACVGDLRFTFGLWPPMSDMSHGTNLFSITSAGIIVLAEPFHL